MSKLGKRQAAIHQVAAFIILVVGHNCSAFAALGYCEKQPFNARGKPRLDQTVSLMADA